MDHASNFRTVRDVFHVLWGPRRHIGIFSEHIASVPEAAEHASRLKAAKTGTSRGQSVLEVGCGFGLDACMLCESYGCVVTAIDAERWRLDEARRYCAA
jgi:cyclopropane fatty-acyl-phospholipid synthase-like methyltransferase